MRGDNGAAGSSDPEMTRERLAELREAEARASAKVVGVDRWSSSAIRTVGCCRAGRSGAEANRRLIRQVGRKSS